MLHCFGFFFSIFFFLPNYCNSTTCKTNTLPPYHESVRSQRPGCRDRERADRAKKPPPGRRGARRRLGGRLQPPLSVCLSGASLGRSASGPGDARALCGARRGVSVTDAARRSVRPSVRPRLLWHRGGSGQGVWGAVTSAGLGAGVAPRLACTKAKPSEPNTKRRSRPGGDERVFGCVLFFVARGGAAPRPGVVPSPPPPGAGSPSAPRGAAGGAAPAGASLLRPPLCAGLGGRPLPAQPRSSGLKESVNLSAPNTSVRNQSSRNLNKKVLLGDPFQYSTEENWKKRLVYMAVEPALASCSSFPFREGFRHRFVSLAPCCRPSPSRRGLGKWVQSPEPSSSRANALPRAHGAAEPPTRGRWCRWHRAGPSTAAAELGLPRAGCRRPAPIAAFFL